MNFRVIHRQGARLFGLIASIAHACTCVVRGLPLFLCPSPGTPLRVLCVMAFDFLHLRRSGRLLGQARRKALATLLDFGALVNADLDNKGHFAGERKRMRQLLDDAGLNAPVGEYLRELTKLERERPVPGGDLMQAQKVITYRESVVRLSLGMMAAAAAHCATGPGEGTQATFVDAELNLLFRIVMQCQIMDDVLDYREDCEGGLPTFLTAVTSRGQALELASKASSAYARHTPGQGICLLRAALLVTSGCAKGVIVLGRWSKWRDQETLPLSGPANTL